MTKAKAIDESRIAQVTVPISKIRVLSNIRLPGWEKRISTLADSIKANGLQSPIKIFAYPPDKPGPNGELYELVFGQRRLAACKRLKWSVISVVFAPSKSTVKERFLAAFAENDAREELSPLEESGVFQRAVEELGLTARVIAKFIGKTDSYVSQRLGLQKMAEPIRKAVAEERITATQARELNRVKDDKKLGQLLKKAEEGLPVVDLKEKINAAIGPSSEKRGRPKKARKAEKEKKAPGTKPVGAKDSEDWKRSAALYAKLLKLMPRVPKMRKPKEVLPALTDLDRKCNKAKEAGDKEREQYLTGFARGMGYMIGLKNVSLPR